MAGNSLVPEEKKLAYRGDRRKLVEDLCDATRLELVTFSDKMVGLGGSPDTLLKYLAAQKIEPITDKDVYSLTIPVYEKPGEVFNLRVRFF